MLRVSAVFTGFPWRLPRPSWPVAASVGLGLLSVSLMPLVHQTLVLAVAVLLRRVAASLALKEVLTSMGFDPVYASVFNRTMGNVEAQGLAIAGPLGESLHALAPGVFAPAAKVIPGAWVTALIGDGVSVLASAIVMLTTNVLFIAAGLSLLVLCVRRRRVAWRVPFLALVFLSAMLQARGLMGLLRRGFSLEDLEIMGLSHVFTKLLPIDSGSYSEMMSGPLKDLAPYLIPAAVIFTLYGTGLAFLLAGLGRPCLLGAKASQLGSQVYRLPMLLVGGRLAYQRLAAVALVIGAATSPILVPSRADYNFPAEAEGPDGALERELVPPAPAPETAVERNGLPGPSVVGISGSDYAYSYTVNGRPERIRGVGYNPMYSHMPQAERASRYDWDFSQMKAAGVNTILGWEREQFDELTLDKAWEYGLGVVMPYYLPGSGDYADPSYRRSVERDVKEWVTRFRSHPALRMWGIGNEVIHYIYDPDAPRAKVFAQFYVKLADQVHALDPDHPVIYRDAEDLYVRPMREALRANGLRRPWFVYGVNFFTNRICEALPDWPNQGMDVPLVVSEFAPSGLSREDRPKGYLKMLRCIAKQYPTVLGGFAYVWTTSGPEAIDRTMGLVDGEGQPVDGSLWALGRFFRHLGGARQ